MTTPTRAGDLDDAEITRELIERMARDIVAMTAALESQAGQEALEAASRVHSEENTEFLRNLIALPGWPTTRRFGEYAQAAAGWLLAFSARIDPGFQRRCLLLLAQLLETGEVEGDFYGFTVDRVLVSQGRRQLYGTQVHGDHPRLRSDEVEDPLRLNARRTQIGLEPLEIEPPRRSRPPRPSPNRKRRGTSRP
ncbi:MAG TPA: DUF6624 domain-containing protein [Actinospica sp.]|jgi:hypothetical protein|nr:DUF6624 domain-containing protein [Actinospica sp.]